MCHRNRKRLEKEAMTGSTPPSPHYQAAMLPQGHGWQELYGRRSSGSSRTMTMTPS
ncbi:hypothetical protein IMZ48_47290 [Candidatus Bathyarchaeota archaeon]|nr:hypothetical protein [Candidatus Bathyarchaeota archaeon]